MPISHQPTSIDHLTGMAAGVFALASMARYVATGTPSETDLQKIEAMPLALADSAIQQIQEVQEIEHLSEQKLTENLSPLNRLGYSAAKHVVSFAPGAVSDSALANVEVPLYRQSTAMARGVRILIALRRYKEAKGRWPESLDEIRSALSEEILTDPINQGSFVYQRTADTFRLYSKGRNNKDEDGNWDYDTGADDYAIGPPRGHNPQPEPQDANSV